MSPGFPLANPSQARLLVNATIWQAFGNWIGTEQTLDLILTPPFGDAMAPVNYTLNWKAGTPLAQALQQTLSAALPAYTYELAISPRLVMNRDQIGIYGSLEALNAFLLPLSKSIITDTGYAGVQLTFDGSTVRAFDFAATSAPGASSPTITIGFQDLIGQPTWIATKTISVKTVLRGDITIASTVSLPQGLVSTTAAAQTGLTGRADLTTFSGPYQAVEIHHYGNYRQPSAESWASVFKMIDLSPS